MMTRRSRGFTLIELLVVIAIIAILAAMLFPVFARARESARKIQCLSNVKNIAMAIAMYMSDYEKGPPWETRQEVHTYFEGKPGGGDTFDPPCDPMTDHANPYLKAPVILDEYIKNRDVWRCPSNQLQGGAMMIYGDPDWFGELVRNQGNWGDGMTLCVKDGTYPNGWGGAVTDSFIQNKLALEYWAGDRNDAAANAFVQSIATNMSWHNVNPSSMGDPSSFMTVHDAGACVDYDSPGLVAYPDLCAAECCDEGCSWADWESCADVCGSFIYFLPPKGGAYARDPDLMKKFTRHLGGVNLGYFDGHASWMNSRAFVNKCIELGKQGVPDPFGLWPWAGGYPQWCGSYSPGFPTFYQP